VTETAALPDAPVDTADISGGELPALELTGVGKRYSLGRRPFEGLRRRLRIRGAKTEAARPADEDDFDIDDDDDDVADEPADDEPQVSRHEGTRAIWALRDITFEVPRGKSVAIIGGGGAGKTTLLKILSRVTPPTEGRVVVRGRVAPLLGRIAPLLQGEFTGRQNVFLLSELYGVPREAAAERLDEVLAFAGLTTFADTKVKKYSSGMQQQLAFSIVLNLDPDVLLADGAVTVGDPIFRARSLERLEERHRQGLALVIASNDTASLRRLCDEAIWLENGRVVARGDVVELTQRYDEGRVGTKLARRQASSPETPRPAESERNVPDTRPKTATVIDAGLFSMEGLPLPAVVPDQETLVEATVVAPRAGVALVCAVTLASGDVPVLRIVQDKPFVALERGWYAVSGYFPAGELPAGGSVGDASAVIVDPGVADAEPPFTDAVDVPEDRHVEWSWQRIRKRTVSAQGHREPPSE
jgi:ABC-type polysaccharide/polyol phosphate transport system ATPase subunit